MPRFRLFFSFFTSFCIVKLVNSSIRVKTCHTEEFLQKVSSGSTTWKVRMILQNSRRRVEGNLLINISSSYIFLAMLLPARFHQKCLAVFGSCEN